MFCRVAEVNIQKILSVLIWQVLVLIHLLFLIKEYLITCSFVRVLEERFRGG
jgi:hypothetical protein